MISISERKDCLKSKFEKTPSFLTTVKMKKSILLNKN